MSKVGNSFLLDVEPLSEADFRSHVRSPEVLSKKRNGKEKTYNKCPECGEYMFYSIDTLSLKCPECGYD